MPFVKINPPVVFNALLAGLDKSIVNPEGEGAAGVTELFEQLATVCAISPTPSAAPALFKKSLLFINQLKNKIILINRSEPREDLQIYNDSLLILFFPKILCFHLKQHRPFRLKLYLK